MTGKENLTDEIRRVLKGRKRELHERFVRPEAPGEATPADEAEPAPVGVRAALRARLDATIGVPVVQNFAQREQDNGGDHGEKP